MMWVTLQGYTNHSTKHKFTFSADVPAESILQTLNVSVLIVYKPNISSFETSPQAVMLSGASPRAELELRRHWVMSVSPATPH